MLIKATTSTSIILLGLSSFASESSSNFENQLINSSHNLYAIELEYNAPEAINSRVDKYVDLFYRMDENLANKYSKSEYGFMSVVQKYSQEQIDLEEDFANALNELFISKIKAKPTKKRF
jgi:hypothetical protein